MADFRQQVYDLVETIPVGRVMTYGQIAALCQKPGAARVVGQIAHFGRPNIPWQRVVKQNGGLASGYYGGLAGHKKDLQTEGVKVSNDYRINIDEYIWWPQQN